MFGIRFAPILSRISMPSIRYSIPKCQYSMINMQTTNLLHRTVVLPSNLIIKNLIEMMQKMNEQMDQDNDKNIKNITLLNQGTLRMSNIKCGRST